MRETGRVGELGSGRIAFEAPTEPANKMLSAAVRRCACPSAGLYFDAAALVSRLI
jgi:hypothetical protein